MHYLSSVTSIASEIGALDNVKTIPADDAAELLRHETNVRQPIGAGATNLQHARNRGDFYEVRDPGIDRPNRSVPSHEPSDL